MSCGGALLITVMMPGHSHRAGMGTAMGHGHYRCQEVLHIHSRRQALRIGVGMIMFFGYKRNTSVYCGGHFDDMFGYGSVSSRG